MESDFVRAGYLHESPFFAKRKKSIFLLHSPTDCDLCVDAKNDIFTWTFVKRERKKQDEGKEERLVKSSSACQGTSRSILYGCNLDILPLTKKPVRPWIIPRIIVDL